MTRALDTKTLDGAVRDYAKNWRLPDVAAPGTLLPGKIAVPGLWLPDGKSYRAGPLWVMQSLYNATFKDEFDYIVAKLLGEELSAKDKVDFEGRTKSVFKPRDEKTFHKLLKEHLAISPSGDHIDGAIGRVEIGVRPIGKMPLEVETLASVRRRKRLGLPIHVPGRTDRETEWVIRPYAWPIYAGEGEERSRPGGGAADPLPEGTPPLPIGANVTNIDATTCIAGIDAIADRLDVGAAAAEIRGRTGAQPADPDASETGTLLFTLPCSDPAVNAGVDDTDGTCSATFAAITDDSSADATGTLGYCRFAATGAGADDIIDGNATTDGTGATDWNTLSIVSGSTVSMTSAVIGQSQGSTAT